MCNSTRTLVSTGVDIITSMPKALEGVFWYITIQRSTIGWSWDTYQALKWTGEIKVPWMFIKLSRMKELVQLRGIGHLGNQQGTNEMTSVTNAWWIQGAGEVVLVSTLFTSPQREGNEGMDFRINFLPLLQIGDNPVPMRGGDTLFLFGDTTLTEVWGDNPPFRLSDVPTPNIISA